MAAKSKSRPSFTESEADELLLEHGVEVDRSLVQVEDDEAPDVQDEPEPELAKPEPADATAAEVTPFTPRPEDEFLITAKGSNSPALALLYDSYGITKPVQRQVLVMLGIQILNAVSTELLRPVTQSAPEYAAIPWHTEKLIEAQEAAFTPGTSDLDKAVAWLNLLADGWKCFTRTRPRVSKSGIPLEVLLAQKLKPLGEACLLATLRNVDALMHKTDGATSYRPRMGDYPSAELGVKIVADMAAVEIRTAAIAAEVEQLLQPVPDTAQQRALYGLLCHIERGPEALVVILSALPSSSFMGGAIGMGLPEYVLREVAAARACWLERRLAIAEEILVQALK